MITIFVMFFLSRFLNITLVPKLHGHTIILKPYIYIMSISSYVCACIYIDPRTHAFYAGRSGLFGGVSLSISGGPEFDPRVPHDFLE